MPEHIIIADPSRTVRTLVKLAFPERADAVIEATEPDGLIEALSAPAETLLVVDDAWAAVPAVRERLSGAAAGVVVLGPATHGGVPWHEVLGLDAACVAAVPKPVSRRSVREAADRLLGATGADASIKASDLRAIVAEEVAKAVRDEVKGVVWRIVPELAERLIKEELERLLKEDEEGEQ